MNFLSDGKILEKSEVPADAKLPLKQGETETIAPQTFNYLGNDVAESSGYTFTISDVRLMSSFTGGGISTPQATALNSSTTIGTNVSKTVIGKTLSVKATTINTLFGARSSLQATLTVMGRDSGARLQIPVIINKTTT